MVSALVFGTGSPASNPGRGHCVWRRLFIVAHSASLHQGTGELNAGAKPAMGSGVVEILLVASCYRNRDSTGLMGYLVGVQTLPMKGQL